MEGLHRVYMCVVEYSKCSQACSVQQVKKQNMSASVSDLIALL